MIEIRNHILFIDGKQVDYKPSPNVGGVIVPTYIVQHYTAAKTAESAIGWMLSKQGGVSAHLHIARDGKVVQLAPFNIKCWHAGASEWKGINGLNSHSIGIELQNDSKEEYTACQLEVDMEICKALIAKYPIKEILGHSEISPGRKVDPGPLFPMKLFKAAVTNDCENLKATTADVNLRPGAGFNYGISAVLHKGTQVTIVKDLGEWSEVKVINTGLTGYVSNKYLA